LVAFNSIEKLSCELERGIALLEELHILSQTEALALESSSMADLKSIVSAKENVVQRIKEAEIEVAAVLREIKPSWFDLRSDDRASLRRLQDRAFLLMGRISEIEEANRAHLERLKAEFAASLRLLKDDDNLRSAYRPPSGAPAKFSRLAD
jgi:hypothetical protein